MKRSEEEDKEVGKAEDQKVRRSECLRVEGKSRNSMG